MEFQSVALNEIFAPTVPNQVTEEQRDQLTPEQRERLEAAGQEALKILRQRMREGRQQPRRHQQFVLLVIFGLIAAALLVAFVVDLLR